MATYKVIQDIEAEDKLLGPLSLRQFIYAAIVAVSGFIAYKLYFLAAWIPLLFLPHMTLFAVLAAPLGHDQPSEIWLLAKVRFFLKPRKRIWDQSGVKELVTITAPKKIDRQLTDNLTQSEVRSRLRALADTIDSRGWAVKTVDVNTYTAPSYAGVNAATSDRLIDSAAMPQEVPTFDTQTVNDMLDENTNATAQHLTQMIDQSTQAHRQQLVTMMQNGGNTTTPQNPQQGTTAPADYWFLNGTNGQAQPVQPGFATFDHNPMVAPGMSGSAVPAPANVNTMTADEAALLQQIHDEQNKINPMNSHLKTIQPLTRLPDGTYVQPEAAVNTQQQPTAPQTTPVQTTPDTNTTMTPVSDPAILDLANNDDLSVATLARQANKARQVDLSSNDEVVISLH